MNGDVVALPEKAGESVAAARLLAEREYYAKVLIIDEMGYLPLNREEAGQFIRLITRRHEKASLTLTSNKGFVDWGESYRLKEKNKAGLLGSCDRHGWNLREGHPCNSSRCS